MERDFVEQDREAVETGSTARPRYRVIYLVPGGERPRTTVCWGFEERSHGVALFDADGGELGYVSHENVVVLEPY